MKLIHQINLAFGVLLALVFAVTAVIIHNVLLDHFMGTQQEELHNLSASISQSINTVQTGQATPLNRSDGVLIRMSALPVASNISAIVTDKQYQLVPMEELSITKLEAIPFTKIIENEAAIAAIPLSKAMQKIVDGTDDRYLTSTTTTEDGYITLLSPVNKIKEIEQKLFAQLIIVLCIGFVLVFLLSLFITKRLINPLMRLREELKKVKNRQFSEVQLIKAGGEIGVVAETVYDLAGELDRYNRVQKQFFQNASHELKSPLMSISGYAEGIRDGVFEGESMRRGLDIITSESNRIKKLVTEMTLLAKLDSEEDIFHFNEVPVRDMLLETEERVNPILVKKKLKLHVHYLMKEHTALYIRADRDKLLQALLNVVTNATRYAEKDIHVYVRKAQDRVLITVQDDGNGIPEQLLPTLFHRFVKGKGGESGLGLAIARAIVERCGGQISASNHKQGGAKLDFDFPVCQA
ncbi:sensor histidine kinase [Paenibacillus sp. 1001270B_150601_E10]|uniref:sensor histidine kinase n=1 Tax=Paenibacillus sp. 1001270B_150601_E10 TaxID=2787079 RepID=UPI00189FC3A9|nr:HAMP domain-containing sensor histidine kinase [Paenibacillus sp. 1001270B_150601_E10]